MRPLAWGCSSHGDREGTRPGGDADDLHSLLLASGAAAQQAALGPGPDDVASDDSDGDEEVEESESRHESD